MSEPYTRQPTHEEAVEWIMRHKLPVHASYRRECIKFDEDNYGADFADGVKREVSKRWEQRSLKGKLSAI